MMDNSRGVLIDWIALPAFVLEPDSTDRPVYVCVNDAASQLSGRGNKELLGRTAKELYPGNFGKLEYEKHVAVMASGEAAVYEIHLPMNGRILHLRTHLNPVKNAAGETIQLVGTSENISAEHDLRESRSQSLRLMRDLEHFINLAAHDLRSPMLKINALTDVIREDFKDLGDGKLKNINSLETVATSALSLIEEVIGRAHATSALESVESFSLTTVCTDILDLLDPDGDHCVEIDDARLYGDRIATQVTLRNLIDNAFKHNKGRKINVSIAAARACNGFFRITVTDDGKGIDNPQLLFTEDPARGLQSSFGLLGVSQLIRARGGVIFAEECIAEEGASISFTLPGELLKADQKHVA